jgi:hypothetical protein
MKNNEDNQQSEIAAIISSASFKKLIEEAIESGNGRDWVDNGEYEYEIPTFDVDIATAKFIEVIQFAIKRLSR